MRIPHRFHAAHRFLLAAFLALPALLPAVELKLADGSRQAVLIEGYDGKGNLDVYLSSGERKQFALKDVAAIYYSGRIDHFIRNGDQSFLFNAGGQIAAAVEKLESGDVMAVNSRSVGRHQIPIKYLHGFTALSVQGRAARMAEDMISEEDASPKGQFLDHLLDRRGVPYAGVLQTFTPKDLTMEQDELLQNLSIQTFKVAGVRLAEADKEKQNTTEFKDILQVGVRCRDGSYVVGELASADPFQWVVRPNWDGKREVEIPTNEISKVDIFGGKTIFLTQLTPIKVEEKTVVAPPQPYRRNSNAQGESMNIGGFIYHNGIGVHASSRLTYRLDGKFNNFRVDVGIDGRLEKEGTVIFSVLGDGKELKKTEVVRGKVDGGGLEISVPVTGCKELTLVVEPTGDLDQADLANWGGARLSR